MKPKLRFNGFEGEWEDTVIGNIATFSKGRGYSKADLCNSGTPIILYGRLYTNYTTTINEVDTFASPKDNSVYSKGGEVIIPASGETPEDIAIASSITPNGIILGGDLNVLTFNQKKHSPIFMALAISNSKTHKELSGYAQGKSIVHLHNDSIAKGHIAFASISEQESIASFFTTLDAQISACTSRLASLKQIKAASLQAMFPQEGETVPKLRFKGFEGEWVKCILGSSSFMTAGGTPSTFIDKFWDGDINWLQSGAVHNCIIYHSSVERTITLEGLHNSSAHLIKKDSVLIAITGATCANVGYLTFESSANQSVVSVEPNSELYSKFIYQSLKVNRTQILSFKGGSAQSGVTLNNLKKLSILCPSYKEQKQIGDYFFSLETQIELQAQRLEKLKQIKSACLDNMFV